MNFNPSPPLPDLSIMETLDIKVAKQPNVYAFTASSVIGLLGTSIIALSTKIESRFLFKASRTIYTSWGVILIAGTALAYKICKDHSKRHHQNVASWGIELGQKYSDYKPASYQELNNFIKRIFAYYFSRSMVKKDDESLFRRAFCNKISDYNRLVNETLWQPTKSFSQNKYVLNNDEAIEHNMNQKIEQELNAIQTSDVTLTESSFNRPIQTDRYISTGSLKNAGHNEDRVFSPVEINTRAEPGEFFGVVVDGHRDKGKIGELIENMLIGFIKDYHSNGQNPINALKMAIHKAHIQCFQDKIPGGAALIIVWNYKDKTYIASLGDCQAVIIRNGQLVRASIVGDWKNEGERRRVKHCFDTIKNKTSVTEELLNTLEKNRWLPQNTVGSSEVSRSIGDCNSRYCNPEQLELWLEQASINNGAPKLTRNNEIPETAIPIISDVPFVTEFTPAKGDKGDILIVGSDGLFNNLNDDEIISLAKQESNLADALVRKAFENKRKIDDISALTIVYK